ncbi:MAG UNVERIFIED_CONTAM: hypothetical protein LVR18_09450 [Planctomycetaceae bacterium]|jgi:hypothetical protein
MKSLRYTVLIFFSLLVACHQPESFGQTPQPADDRPAVLLVLGASGTEDYGKAFQQWAERWQKAATTSESEFQWIGPGGTPAASAATTTTDRDQLRAALETACNRRTTQPLWLVYIGHGTFDQQTAGAQPPRT